MAEPLLNPLPSPPKPGAAIIAGSPPAPEPLVKPPASLAAMKAFMNTSIAEAASHLNATAIGLISDATLPR
jgi:hypothetical protein